MLFHDLISLITKAVDFTLHWMISCVEVMSIYVRDILVSQDSVYLLEPQIKLSNNNALFFQSLNESEVITSLCGKVLFIHDNVMDSNSLGHLVLFRALINLNSEILHSF